MIVVSKARADDVRIVNATFSSASDFARPNACDPCKPAQVHLAAPSGILSSVHLWPHCMAALSPIYPVWAALL